MKITGGDKSSKEHIEQRYDNIAKSENDTKEYRGLELKNKLKVLLISDPQTDQSVACLDVRVGDLNNPKDLPGLAHFCEHMLFLGTKKYPEYNEYTSYINQNGGFYNATTNCDHTMFFFNVNPKGLHGALDRFAQFFVAPLFSESYTERELSIIDSEHEKNLVNDNWRLAQLDASSADPSHPYSMFATGNKQTLDIIPKQKGINIRERLLEFHEKYYSANIMTLCVFGKESLDELEQIVVELFSEIPNKNVKLETWSSPFTKEHMQYYWFIVPVKDIRLLTMKFEIPDMREYYEAQPLAYISHLLEHEGEGSLLSVLKEKGFCTSLTCTEWAIAKGFNFLYISVDLIHDGMQHVDEIIELIFQYINMLKREGPIKRIWDEFRDIAKTEFRFKEFSPLPYVKNRTYALHDYPMEKILTANYVYSEWRPDLITMLLDCLTPENIRVNVMGRAFEDIADETEPWYGTKYKKAKIPEETIDKWINAGLYSDFKLPSANEFIPTQVDIKPAESSITKYPVIVEETPLMRVWFKQDDEFLSPRANIWIEIVSPVAFMDPLSCTANMLFVCLVKESLKECTYNACLAGLNWDMYSVPSGITINIGGFNDKQRVFLEQIFDAIVNFEPDAKWFEVFKEKNIRSLKNFEALQPNAQARYYLTVLQSDKVWIREELLTAVSYLTLEHIQHYARQFLSKWHMECLIHGNYTTAEAVSLSKFIESKLTNSVSQVIPLVPKQLHASRNLRLDDGSYFLLEVENKVQSTSCTQVYFQCGLQTTETNVLLMLLKQVLGEPSFSILRTKEQLAYIVHCSVFKSYSEQGLLISLVSDRHPRFLEHRVDAFLETMVDYIKNMLDGDFAKHKRAVISIQSTKPETLSELTKKFWNEIILQTYNFDRENIEIAHMQTVTKEQLVQFFLKTINKDTRRKLSIHVQTVLKEKEEPEKAEDSPETNLISGYSKIEDIMSFKLSQSLAPLLPTCNGIPRKGKYSVSKL